MTGPTPATRGPARATDPDRRRPAEPPDHHGGVGASSTCPAMSVIVRGLDAWSPERAGGDRGAPAARRGAAALLGSQVRALRTAPWDPQDNDDPYTHRRARHPVPPVAALPALPPAGPARPAGQFELVHRYGRRPTWPSGCTRTASGRPRSATADKRAVPPGPLRRRLRRRAPRRVPLRRLRAPRSATEPCPGAAADDARRWQHPRPAGHRPLRGCCATRNISAAAGTRRRGRPAALPRPPPAPATLRAVRPSR